MLDQRPVYTLPRHLQTAVAMETSHLMTDKGKRPGNEQRLRAEERKRERYYVEQRWQFSIRGQREARLCRQRK